MQKNLDEVSAYKLSHPVIEESLVRCLCVIFSLYFLQPLHACDQVCDIVSISAGKFLDE